MSSSRNSQSPLNSSRRNTPSNRNSSSPSPSSRSPSPTRKSFTQQLESILENDFCYKISIIVFIVLTCIVLSFSFENDPNSIPYPDILKSRRHSMQVITNILYVLSIIYFVTAFIVRRT